ncbi:RNA 2',3'-cyclic phosphodiesterase [Tepidimonas taiwanensis]|uniref:RNA 2',3'-cyclic phosphodiesterase n=1 Tax=Tepidimonas taiwanensis TaxID=307486 RepID=UPI000A51BC3B|nr:RNA 2',3'-cyclic phosphodiesterase [Tepidimonas taiwanensis]
MTPATADAPATARLFLALWPDAMTRQAIAAAAARWHWPPGVRPYAPDDWHVTLHFLGAVPLARLPALQAGLAVPFTPFRWTLEGPACWPHGLAVLASARAAPPLAALHRRLAHALRALALPVETWPLRPHVTLARRADGAQCPAGGSPIVWPVREYVLARSTGEPAPRYTIVARYPATGP